MGFREIECFTIICDEPGCTNDFMDDYYDGEYGGDTKKNLLNNVFDSDWKHDEEADKFFCPEHWKSEQEERVDSMVLVQNFDPTGLPPTMAELIDGEWVVPGILRTDMEPLTFYYPKEEPPC